MEGEMSPFDFQLAERLGKTLAEIGAMPNREYLAWRAFAQFRNAKAELGEIV